MTPRIGVAGIPGAWSTDRLTAALTERGARAFAFDLQSCSFDLGDGSVRLDGKDLCRLDAVVVKKLGSTTDPLTPHRVQMLRQMEFRGVRVFSPADAVAEVNDRYRMTQRLRLAGIPMPRTIVTEDIDLAAEVIEDWGRAVLKPIFTSKGLGMLLLRGDAAHRHKLRRWKQRWMMPFYLQEFVPQRDRDLGVMVLNGAVLGAYYRVGRGDSWLTTTSAGGRYAPCPVTPEMSAVALDAARVFRLDFTGVDLVQTPAGFLVYEVSAFGGFAGLHRTGGPDAAAAYADHVLDALAAGGRDEPARTRAANARA
jgi:ribosomal protein S6--L-glutamate ligase